MDKHLMTISKTIISYVEDNYGYEEQKKKGYQQEKQKGNKKN